MAGEEKTNSSLQCCGLGYVDLKTKQNKTKNKKSSGGKNAGRGWIPSKTLYLQPSDYDCAWGGGEGDCRKDFYTFCVRLKSVTEQHVGKKKRRPPRPGHSLPLPLSVSELHFPESALILKTWLQKKKGVGMESKGGA